MGTVGELERNTIVDNVKLGMTQRSRQGRWNDGICLGYESEPIITQELWDRVQAIQKSKVEKPMKNYEGNYVLTGFMKYPFCGATMVGTRTVNKLKDGTIFMWSS